MALDESKDTDEVFDVDGFNYIADKEFLEKAKPITVDFAYTGFKISSSIKFDEAAAGCGGCSGSCG